MRATATRWLGILASPWFFGCAGSDGREGGPQPDNAPETTAAAGATADDALERARCGRLESGPFVPQLVTQAAWASGDVAFDRKGHIVRKKGFFLSAVPAFGPSRFVSRDDAIAGLSLGLRFLPNGD